MQISRPQSCCTDLAPISSIVDTTTQGGIQIGGLLQPLGDFDGHFSANPIAIEVWLGAIQSGAGPNMGRSTPAQCRDAPRLCESGPRDSSLANVRSDNPDHQLHRAPLAVLIELPILPRRRPATFLKGDVSTLRGNTLVLRHARPAH